MTHSPYRDSDDEEVVRLRERVMMLEAANTKMREAIASACRDLGHIVTSHPAYGEEARWRILAKRYASDARKSLHAVHAVLFF